VVVVPDDHVENIYDLDGALAADIHEAARLVAIAMKRAFSCGGVSTRQHNEPAAQQEVWHYHPHVFPRFDGDDLYGSAARLTAPEEWIPYAAALRAELQNL
jgi:histidine triad (HIT) family protein